MKFLHYEYKILDFVGKRGMFMLKKLIGNKARKPLIISLVFVLITLCILFYLTFQPPADTVALSEKVGHLPVVEDFLNWASTFVDWSVRQWAHIFEFLIIGMCVSIFYAFATTNIGTMMVLALLTCVCISLCDQTVRIFIVGRHFDSFDLVLDALGYVSAIGIVSICRVIYRLVVNRK
jgi:VanZ family protein